jgi:hypothetical protein
MTGTCYTFDPWGAFAFAKRHEPLADGPDPADDSVEATRARVRAAIEASERVIASLDPKYRAIVDLTRAVQASRR